MNRLEKAPAPKPTMPINTSHPSVTPSHQREDWISARGKCTATDIHRNGWQLEDGRQRSAPASTPSVDLLLVHGVQAWRRRPPHRVCIMYTTTFSSLELAWLDVNWEVVKCMQPLLRDHEHWGAGEALLPGHRHRQQPHLDQVPRNPWSLQNVQQGTIYQCCRTHITIANGAGRAVSLLGQMAPRARISPHSSPPMRSGFRERTHEAQLNLQAARRRAARPVSA